MKSSEEMVRSLMLRRDEYEIKQKTRRKTVRRVSTIACSLALVLLVGAGVSGGWWITSQPELPTVTPTQTVTAPTEPLLQTPTTLPAEVEPATTAPVTPTEAEPVTEQPVSADQIVVHEIGDTSNSLMYIALMRDDFVPMTEDELRDYYGTEFVPEVPEDLESLRRESALGIYRRDGGTGEIYHDEQRLEWVTEDYSRGISVTVRKDRLPYQFFALLTQEEMETSEICGVEVSIGRTAEGTWLAEFLYKDVGFRICADGLTQEELVAVVASLVG